MWSAYQSVIHKIDVLFKEKYSESEIERRKEVQSYRDLVGEQD